MSEKHYMLTAESNSKDKPFDINPKENCQQKWEIFKLLIT